MGILSRLLGIEEIRKRSMQIEAKFSNLWEWINYLNYKLGEIEKRFNEIDKRLTEIENLAREEYDREDLEREAKIEEKFLLQIFHNLAAFSQETAIETGRIYRNIPFLITIRGLRKKLEQMESRGILKSFRSGNRRYWYISEGKIEEVKSIITGNVEKSKEETKDTSEKSSELT
ncbi:MAG: hypothetical protein QW507_02715 [Candidatus Nanoarchaeia archaeon]|nr:hypothetical protein [Candidatus Haiyanarchaeum thermophilum]MCW1303326.1 hypothetical protein [Candidatus Haiyanarchaeum thermophilum]MCW1304092.1 hypothetical protein [Candidatus Haiyanarchaeum thermophilum]MCW1306485.1 hypothetical protein [Candidatus Haiyanarchaeum thermophilum]MCW1307218.1 hypothetical protein [Candidatus Haiyanarchaeum thermophilum]